MTGLNCGADDYIGKPFSSDILLLKIKGIIDNRRRLRESLLNQALCNAANDDIAPAQPEEDTGVAESDREFVTKATEIVLEHIADTDFTIDALCREMAMSRTLFFGRIKALTGKAPQDFIRLLRLEKAADMLRNGAQVVDAAEATGFVNTKYFSTVFKKQFGVPPSKFSVGLRE